MKWIIQMNRRVKKLPTRQPRPFFVRGWQMFVCSRAWLMANLAKLNIKQLGPPPYLPCVCLMLTNLDLIIWQGGGGEEQFWSRNWGGDLSLQGRKKITSLLATVPRVVTRMAIFVDWSLASGGHFEHGYRSCQSWKRVIASMFVNILVIWLICCSCTNYSQSLNLSSFVYMCSTYLTTLNISLKKVDDNE